MFIKKLIETKYHGNLFTKEPVESHTRSITINKLIKKITSCNMSNQELLEESLITCWKINQLRKYMLTHIIMQTKDVSINLITNVNFIKKGFPKGHIVFQVSPPLTLWL